VAEDKAPASEPAGRAEGGKPATQAAGAKSAPQATSVKPPGRTGATGRPTWAAGGGASLPGWPAGWDRPGQTGAGTRTLLLAVVTGPADAASAVADGADLLDVSGCGEQARAAIRQDCPGALLWDGPGDGHEPVDADLIAATVAGTAPGAEPVAGAVAAAALGAWLGAALVRTRHVLAVRRALDMTATIVGTRLPALTVRGLG
jgi:hypothetical protein